MSRYFSRLAQRSGFAPPAAARAARAPASDLIEQENIVDVPATGGRALLPTVPAATSSADVGVSRHPTVSPAAPQMAGTQPPTRIALSTPGPTSAANEVNRHVVAVTTAETVQAPPPSQKPRASETARAAAPAPRTAREHSSTPPLETDAPVVKSSASTIIERLRHIESTVRTPGTAPAFSNERPQEAMAQKTTLPATTTEAVRGQASAENRNDTPLEATERHVEMHTRIASDTPMQRASRSGRTGTPSSGTTPAARPADAGNVDVRIGTVRLEVHTPPHAAGPTPPAPAAPRADESPRFSLRRHHLRG